MIYFTADNHYLHKASIMFDDRPFRNISEMTEQMVLRHNSIVTKDDLTYILGDFSWGKADETVSILKRLNGRKILIKGNHDNVHNSELKKQFDYISSYEEIKVDGVDIVLCHYPINFFNGHFHGSYHLFGHVHNSHEHNQCLSLQRSMIDVGYSCKMQNVGVMHWDYKPVTFEQIVQRQDELEKRVYEESVKEDSMIGA